MRSKIKPYVIAIAVTFGAALLSSLVTMRSFSMYSQLPKPPLAPPAILFPIVWSVLYLLMAIGVAMCYNDSTGLTRQRAVQVYIRQLFVNVLWPIFFFVGEFYLFSFFWLLLLLALVLWMTVVFYSIRPAAGLLQLPYILWLCFAGYLNFAIYLLSR